MAIDITERVQLIFWVKEDDKSPYQGLLSFTPEEYEKITDEELQAKQLEQHAEWKVNTAIAQAQNDKIEQGK